MKSNRFTHTPTSWETVFEARTRLCEFISGHRLAHTLSVEKEALDMAKKLFPALGISDDYLSDVSCSALLHDLTKHYDLQGQLELCEKYSIDIDESSEKSSAILHSKTAAFLAKELFNINDCVFNAIYCHTVGGDEMDIIAKIIFLADYIEPTRDADACKAVRNMFYAGISENPNNPEVVLDSCIIKSIDYTLKYLVDKNSTIHIQTVRTRNRILAATH